jgi:hypothetical protein
VFLPTAPRSRWALGVLVAVVAAGAVAVPLAVGAHAPGTVGAAHRAVATAAASPTPVAVPVVTAATTAALPEARYDAVVGDLLPWTRTVTTDTVFRLTADAPLFGADRRRPVARFAAQDFLGQPSAVVGVRRDGPWELVLTPARRQLPSTAGSSGAAPQTAAWVPVALLADGTTPSSRVVVSTSDQSVSIVSTASGAVQQRFGAGVGTAATPTPTGVSGYLEQRYADPTQGTGDHPIQLTSLHSGAADEPYGGHDGGLIGMHWNATTSGAVSHGCVRLDAAAVAALDALPLGTLVTVV